jgi:LmbE family N-acetylglucosaminyl deacetylase
MFITRRRLLASAAALVACAVDSEAAESAGRLKIVIAGGHPGDPECGCGGVIARYAELGHDVVLLYLNRGEAYCHSTGLGQCGDIRTAEAQRACRILKARAAFVGQYDGRAIIDPPHYDEFRRLLDREKPDIVFAHWPIDAHPDHRAISMLALDAWLRSGKTSALYFYEVAGDTMMFSPADFVDITGVQAQRRAACYAHASQQPEKWFPEQEELTRMRGRQSGFQQAEAFVRHWESRRGLLP